VEHLDLFSGIGGFSLAAGWAGLKTVVAIEIDEKARKIYKKNNPEVEVYEDIREFKADEFYGCFLVTGGFPCTPFSHCGKQRGKEDNRNLWPEMFRVIRECRPSWVIGENVIGIVALELDEILSDLESEGYETRTFIIPACSKDARHRRDRVWIVGNTDSNECRRRKQVPTSRREEVFDFEWSGEWPSSSGILRTSDGISSGMDRVKLLGNSLVPQVAFEIINSMVMVSNERS